MQNSTLKIKIRNAQKFKEIKTIYRLELGFIITHVMGEFYQEFSYFIKYTFRPLNVLVSS